MPALHRKSAAAVLLVPLLAALALWAFAWPATRTAPRDLPLGVAGAPAAAAPVERRLAARDGAFEVHRYADEAAARAAIEDRKVYGAVVATPDGPKLLTASAASPVVAQLLQQALTAQAPAGTKVTTVDVVPAPAADPRGAALSSSILPLVIAGVAAGAAVTLMRLRGVRAVCTLLGIAAVVGIVGAALADSWLGALTGDWWTEAGVLGLTSLAISGSVAGLAALLGPAGIGLGAVTMVLLGNAFSGVASAPQLLPEPVGAIGQLLPPGAGGSLLRSVAYFDGAAATTPVITLAAWAGPGLTAVLLGSLRGRRAAGTAGRTAAPAPVPEPVG
ncbi:ABC transporter permease [Streptomyces sp. VRA16 Mangrove soil]|uniref:ABC transporter permease n=1 Tax=Streptomyces sp. VRA16 Mangrove soil TaxID=2817434 RepID=UPI001A9D3681|nr:ABC transporter permease [Streptomyces sp. VRA16 Mangrove soil]MBO1332385.1 ABC transporter permease [Streptomyces sp. VRA16 Mangrove soil]